MSEGPLERSRDTTSNRDRGPHTPEPNIRGEVSSAQLFAGAKALFIRHGGERYTLRRTSKGKLILTK